MHVFAGARLPKPRRRSRGQRAGDGLRLGELVAASRAREQRGLQARGRLVLADVDPARLRDACHLAKHLGHDGQVAGAHGMDDEVESAGSEHREVVHRSLDDLEVDPPLAGDRTVEREHRWREVDHGHASSGRRIERAVLAAPRGEAEHVEAVEAVRDPASTGGSRGAEPATRVVEGCVDRRPRQGHAGCRQEVPAAAILLDRRRPLSLSLRLTHDAAGCEAFAHHRRASPPPPLRARRARAPRSP